MMKAHLVKVEDCQLDLLVLMLLLLGLSVSLLLPLLGSTKKPQENIHRGVIRNPSIIQRRAILQLSGAKDKPLVLNAHPC